MSTLRTGVIAWDGPSSCILVRGMTNTEVTWPGNAEKVPGLPTVMADLMGVGAVCNCCQLCRLGQGGLFCPGCLWTETGPYHTGEVKLHTDGDKIR